MTTEPGLRSTDDLVMSLSQHVAAPGDQLTITTEPRSDATFVRGKIIYVEERDETGWQTVGALIVERATTRWIRGENPTIAVTLEGYHVRHPMHFEVPPLAPGQYRLRLDVIALEGAGVRERTATLYAPLHIA